MSTNKDLIVYFLLFATMWTGYNMSWLLTFGLIRCSVLRFSHDILSWFILSRFITVMLDSRYHRIQWFPLFTCYILFIDMLGLDIACCIMHLLFNNTCSLLLLLLFIFLYVFIGEVLTGKTREISCLPLRDIFMWISGDRNYGGTKIWGFFSEIQKCSTKFQKFSTKIWGFLFPHFFQKSPNFVPYKYVS